MTQSEQLIALVVIAAITASVAVWTTIIVRLRHGQQILPLEPRRPAPWAFVDLVLVVMAYILLMMLGQVLLRNVSGIEVPEDVRALGDHLIPLQLAYIGAMLATLVFAVVLVCLRSGATAADLGLRLDRWRYDLLVGIVAFIALAPPVYALQATLVHFFPTQHPLIDILREGPGTDVVFVVSLSVAVVAPLSEEFLLRVLLQGWMERVVATTTPSAFRPAGGETTELPAAEPRSVPAGEAQSENPYAAPQARSFSEYDTGEIGLARAIPIVTSALIFALLHVGHGPAPLPLFFLALGLGYLYQRTHRLWPSVLVHCLLNTSSLLMLWLVPA
jgi:membrane protease YdiL (CAAX protease family)